MTNTQFVTWLTCQFCGRLVLRRTARWWLDEPHRTMPGVRVVRCPEHWSEWALRNTKAGRTKAMRLRMAKAKARPVPPIPAYLGPFPIKEKWEARAWVPTTTDEV